jgi:hypothetical protein
MLRLANDWQRHAEFLTKILAIDFKEPDSEEPAAHIARMSARSLLAFSPCDFTYHMDEREKGTRARRNMHADVHAGIDTSIHAMHTWHRACRCTTACNARLQSLRCTSTKASVRGMTG